MKQMSHSDKAQIMTGTQFFWVGDPEGSVHSKANLTLRKTERELTKLTLMFS